MNQSRLWTIGAVLVIVALIGGTWLIGVSPRLAEAREADGSLQAAQTINSAHRETLADLKAEAEHLGDVTAQLEELQTVIPETPEISRFIAEIEALARLTDVRITAIALNEPVPYVPPEFDDARIAAASNTAAQNGLYVIPINVIAEGSESALLSFTAALQRGTRLVLVYGVSVGMDADGGSVTIQGQLFGLTGIPPAEPVTQDGQKP